MDFANILVEVLIKNLVAGFKLQVEFWTIVAGMTGVFGFMLAILVYLRIHPPPSRAAVEIQLKLSALQLQGALLSYRCSIVESYLPVDVGPMTQWKQFRAAVVRIDILANSIAIDRLDWAWVAHYLALIEKAGLIANRLANLEVNTIIEARNAVMSYQTEVDSLVGVIDSAIGHVAELNRKKKDGVITSTKPGKHETLDKMAQQHVAVKKEAA